MSLAAMAAHVDVYAQTTQTPSASEAIVPGYLVVVGRTLDRPRLLMYSATLPPIYAASGGRYIGFGRPGAGVTCIHGACEGRSAVIATWADSQKVAEFWWSDAYRKVVPLRDRAGVFTVIGLRGHADAKPFASGALLIANTLGNSGDAPVKSWLDAATREGARSLTPYDRAAVMPFEGDAMHDRVLLLSFESIEKRNAFVASAATQSFIKGAPSLFLLSLTAIDAPPTPPTPPTAPPAAPAPAGK
jgi:uncharacterized protein (DUF1330 family)